MRSRAMLLLALIAQAAGCASPPAPECEYAQTAYHVQLAAGGVETPADAFATLPVEADLNGPHPVEFYVQLALERNPDVLAAQRRVAAEAEVIPQATALDDPLLTEMFWPIDDHTIETAAGRVRNGLTLAQKFPWLGKLRVRGEVAEQETKIALTGLAEAQLKVIEDVHLAFYELYYHQQAITIAEQSEELLDLIVQFADVRYQAGGSQQDVLRAELELDRLRDQLIALRQQLRMAQADLAAVLHTSPEATPQAESPLVLPPTPVAVDRLYDLATRCRPELQGRWHAIVRDERKRELAALSYYPDVNLQVGWNAVTAADALSGVANGNDQVSFGVGVNLPIWRDRLRAGVLEAEHRAVESARRYDAGRDDTFRRIRRLIARIDGYEQQIELYQERIVPGSVRVFRVSLADYQVVKVDFLQVLDNWNELLMFQMQLARLQADLGQSLASLERVVGCELAALPDAAEAATSGGQADRLPHELPPEPVPDFDPAAPAPMSKPESDDLEPKSGFAASARDSIRSPQRIDRHASNARSRGLP